jgi:hypothetical protein
VAIACEGNALRCALLKLFEALLGPEMRSLGRGKLRGKGRSGNCCEGGECEREREAEA